MKEHNKQIIATQCDKGTNSLGSVGINWFLMAMVSIFDDEHFLVIIYSLQK